MSLEVVCADDGDYAQGVALDAVFDGCNEHANQVQEKFNGKMKEHNVIYRSTSFSSPWPIFTNPWKNLATVVVARVGAVLSVIHKTANFVIISIPYSLTALVKSSQTG